MSKSNFSWFSQHEVTELTNRRVTPRLQMTTGQTDGDEVESDLVTLCAGVQQALLDGELQQVVILVPHWLAAAWAEGSVVFRRLKHRGVHLTVEGRERLTWVKKVHDITK